MSRPGPKAESGVPSPSGLSSGMHSFSVKPTPKPAAAAAAAAAAAPAGAQKTPTTNSGALSSSAAPATAAPTTTAAAPKTSLPPRLQPKQSPSSEHLFETPEALLRRVSQFYNFSPNSPQWEKARKAVVASISGGSRLNLPDAPTRLEPRDYTKSPSGVQSTASRTAHATPETAPRGRGRPPGRARGPSRATGRPRGSRAGAPGRGRAAGRRKRDDDDDDDDDDDGGADGDDGDEGDSDSDVSVSYTPQTTHTKSGRNINKPTQFVPPPPPPPAEASPPVGGKRKRRQGRKSVAENAQLCAKCSRGHSPASNMVVFCDGCNLAYHQWCHDPHIPREVIDIPEKEWFCGRCQSRRELELLPIHERVSGQALTQEERREHLSSLAHPTLVRLLLRATALHPGLPVYTPDAREALRSKSSSLSPIPNHANGPVADDAYPDYSNPNNDPPATYPRPGSGPIPLQPTTEPERLQWLVDDNFDVYSHSYDNGNGEGLRPVDRSKGDAWIQHVDGKRQPGPGESLTNGHHHPAGPTTAHEQRPTAPGVDARDAPGALDADVNDGEDIDMQMFDGAIP